MRHPFVCNAIFIFVFEKKIFSLRALTATWVRNIFHYLIFYNDSQKNKCENVSLFLCGFADGYKNWNVLIFHEFIYKKVVFYLFWIYIYIYIYVCVCVCVCVCVFYIDGYLNLCIRVIN